MYINTARLLRTPASVYAPQRPEVVTHRSRPGFIERQDGSWICLPIHSPVQRRRNKPKARRRLWHWLAGMLGDNSRTQSGGKA
ncbi:hypothetical protein [Oceanisphaera psychrotolerans]|uniref:Uncharacterized protein n=1 Tax=Oceanisphaera psychrotolerans TaxID=1414654 RepID=A0A1J4QG86_9GAMM|nr:hypothetical protein [Oceanisphaera psychrotolerans]OIN09100.1 hypothetical protein BFR47_02145 [Oceanisphaera psychrotolerans]